MDRNSKQVKDAKTRRHADAENLIITASPRYSLPLPLLSMLLAILCGGCMSTYLTETNPEKLWSSSRYREMKHEDEQRLIGEDRNTSDPDEYITYVPRQAWSVVEWTWNNTTGHSISRYARDQFDKNPDVRRKAIYVLCDHRFARKEPYTKYYAHMAANDVDPTVRAAAMRALNRSRDKNQTKVYVAGLSDSSEWVRLEAAKALANIPDPKGVPTLMTLLADEKQSRDIRIACADALRCFKQSDVAQALIRVLSDRDFGTAWQARRSLNLMTAQDFRYDQAAWLRYLTTTDKPFRP